jgi:hypothetical protein
MRISFLFPPSTIASENFSSMLDRQVSFVELLDRPDIESNTHVFRGMKSRFAPRGPLGPQEATLPQLYQWILDRCEDAITNTARAPATRP